VNNGHKTERGRLTIIGAQTSNGSRTFSPVLWGIETQEDWDTHLAGIQASLSPVGHLESELAYKVALTLRQWHRLDRSDNGGGCSRAFRWRRSTDDHGDRRPGTLACFSFTPANSIYRPARLPSLSMLLRITGLQVRACRVQIAKDKQFMTDAQPQKISR
jgi:hypothetical protein